MKMDSQPKTLSVAGGLSLVVCIGQVTLRRSLGFCPILYSSKHIPVFDSYGFSVCDHPICCTYFQIVLVRDKKKVFTMDDHGYEATVGAIHPGGTTVAIGGEVSGHLFKRQIFIEKVSELWVTACLGVLTTILFEVLLFFSLVFWCCY